MVGIIAVFIALMIFAPFTIIPFIRYLQTRNNRAFEGEPLIAFSEFKIFSAERYYFNSKGIFIYRGQNLLHHYLFEELTLLNKTATTINHRRLWIMAFETESGKKHYHFAPKDTFLSNSFTQFYTFLKKHYPEKVKGKWWRWLPDV